MGSPCHRYRRFHHSSRGFGFGLLVPLCLLHSFLQSRKLGGRLLLLDDPALPDLRMSVRFYASSFVRHPYHRLVSKGLLKKRCQ